VINISEQIIQKPFCETCTKRIGSQEYNDCCENRIYWTRIFDSIKDTNFMKGKPLPKLKGYPEYVEKCKKEFKLNNKRLNHV
jgi:hypothetical protein